MLGGVGPKSLLPLFFFLACGIVFVLGFLRIDRGRHSCTTSEPFSVQSTCSVMNPQKTESVGSRARLVGLTLGAVSLGLVASPAHAAITSNVLTDVQATFATTQSMGEAASVVAATLALISVAVSFIWRARG